MAGDRCPDCSGETRVVTVVTVPALAGGCGRVLVTLQCTKVSCQLKFPVFRNEADLDAAERGLWRRR